VAFFIRNLQLNPGETPANVFLLMQNQVTGLFVQVAAEDVRAIPNSEFTQVVVRLPNNLTPGTYLMQIAAHQRGTNIGVIRIGPLGP
jgi:hypothetical protein